MHLHALDYVLWLAAPCLQVALLLSMRRRRLHLLYPYFYVYTILGMVSDIYLVVVERFSYLVYFYSYWALSILSILISFALVDELFRQAFREFSSLRDFGQIIFRWAFVVVALAACVTAWASPESGGIQRLNEGVLVADRTVRGMLCALTILLLGGSVYLRKSHTSMLFGIALGFAIFTLTKVVVETSALQHPGDHSTLMRINSLAYSVACAVWVVYANLDFGRPPAQSASQADEKMAVHPSPVSHPLLESLNDLVERTMNDKRT